MLKNILYLLATILITGCANQKKTELFKKQDKIKTFDITEYKTILDSKGKKHPRNYTIMKIDLEGSSTSHKSQVRYLRKDGVYVEITDNGGNYILLKEKEPSSLYTMNYYYSSETRLLKGNGLHFYDIPVGTYVRYDEQGNIKERINYDKRYQDHCKFKIEDLVKKLKEVFDIDISNPFKSKNNGEIQISLYIPREGTIPGPGSYFVNIREGYQPEYKIYSAQRTIQIDCNTGAVLKDKTSSIIY